MIRRTLYFGNEAYLSSQKKQLIIRFPDKEKEAVQVPIEDIGIVLLDHYRLTLTSTLLNKLLENNVAVITCDAQHLPLGMFLNLNGHTLQHEHFANQIAVSQAKKDRLWKQVIQAKISNQATLLENQGVSVQNMRRWESKVKNGDPENLEARAARYYWKQLFGELKFTRERFGVAPNGLLNYGYTILRGVVARALVGSGLLPTLGIHHHNKYNAYCLADDIMEPYRPFVDAVVLTLVKEGIGKLTSESKQTLLKIPTLDVMINQQRSPLMVAIQQTTASLQYCYAGTRKILKLPSFV